MGVVWLVLCLGWFCEVVYICVFVAILVFLGFGLLDVWCLVIGFGFIVCLCFG